MPRPRIPGYLIRSPERCPRTCIPNKFLGDAVAAAIPETTRWEHYSMQLGLVPDEFETKPLFSGGLKSFFPLYLQELGRGIEWVLFSLNSPRSRNNFIKSQMIWSSILHCSCRGHKEIVIIIFLHKLHCIGLSYNAYVGKYKWSSGVGPAATWRWIILSFQTSPEAWFKGWGWGNCWLSVIATSVHIA